MNIEFNENHDNPNNSQLVMCLTGNPQFILEKLEEIVEQIKNGPDKKPVQSQIQGSYGHTHVITPIWKHEKY
jgi:hypothetical protein